MIPGRLALTRTRSTPDGSRLMMISGLRITTTMTRDPLVNTARPPPSGARRTDTVTVTVATATPRALLMPPPRALLPPSTERTALTGMLGAEIRTSKSMSPTSRHGPSPTMLSPTMSGTTRMVTEGAPRDGARTRTNKELPPTVPRHPTDPTLSTNSTLTASPTVPTEPRATVVTVDMVPLTASSPVTPTPACTASSTPAAKSLARTTKLPTRAPPPRPVTITTPGPRTPTVKTPTPGGASPTTLSTPTSTTT